MFRVLIAVGCVVAGVAYLLTGSLQHGTVACAMLLPIASIACIALLWE